MLNLQEGVHHLEFVVAIMQSLSRFSSRDNS